MEYNFWNIFGGIALIKLFGFTSIVIITLLFMKYYVKRKLALIKFLLAAAVLMVAWLISTLVSVMFISSFGNLVFGLSAFGLIFVSSYLLSGYFLKLKGKEKILYSLALAVIINPVWYFLLG